MRIVALVVIIFAARTKETAKLMTTAKVLLPVRILVQKDFPMDINAVIIPVSLF